MMKRILLLMALLLFPAAASASTWTGNPEVFSQGRIAIKAKTAITGTVPVGYAVIQWLDADSDGTVDAGDGLIIRYNGTNYGPFLISGDAAPVDATYITQTANGTLTNEQALSLLSTGLVKVTNGTGVLSTATAGTDYFPPISSPSQGDILYYNGSAWAKLAAGTSGYYLKTLGAGNNPAWAAAGSVTGSGTDNHPMRWDGTGAAQDTPNWTFADTTGRMAFSGAVAGDYALIATNTSTTDLSAGVAGYASGASGATFGVTGTSDANTAGATGVAGNANGGSAAVIGVYGSENSSSNTAYALYAAQALYTGTHIDLADASTPANPATGASRLYSTSAQQLRTLDDLGVNRAINGTAYYSVADSSTISNTGALTNFDTTYSIPANTLGERCLRIKASGTIAYNSSPPANVMLYVRIGSTTVAQFGTFAATGSASGLWTVDATITVRAAGGSAVVVGGGTAGIYDGTVSTVLPNRASATTIDTTATHVCAVAILFAGPPSVNNTAICKQIQIDLI